MEGEATQKRGNPKNFFFFTRNQPLPLAQDHLIPLFWLKIRDSAPHPGSSFPFFQPTMEAPPHEGEPLFLLIPSYTINGGFLGFSSSPQSWAGTHSPQSLFHSHSQPPPLGFSAPPGSRPPFPLETRAPSSPHFLDRGRRAPSLEKRTDPPQLGPSPLSHFRLPWSRPFSLKKAKTLSPTAAPLLFRAKNQRAQTSLTISLAVVPLVSWFSPKPKGAFLFLPCWSRHKPSPLACDFGS